jgi:hypothetical protein
MVIASLSFIVPGAILLSASYYEWYQNKKINTTPTSTVRSIAIGRTELHGTIDSDESVTAPISQEPCVCYYVLVSGGQNKNGLPALYRQQTDSVPAFLKDETGEVNVDLNGVQVKDGTTTRHEYSRVDGDVPNYMQTRIDEAGIDVKLTDGKSGCMVEERRIDHGDDVYLLGTARDNPDVKDGTATNSTDDIVIEAANNPYMIANTSEDALSKSLSAKSWIAFGLGFTLTLFGLITLILLTNVPFLM